MKITFTGVPGEEHDEIHAYGYTFKKGEAVDVTDKLAQTKLAGHPHFSGGTPNNEPLILPQTIPLVARQLVVDNGSQSITESEVNAINADDRLLPGYRVDYDEALAAKEQANGNDQRVGAPGSAETDGAGAGQRRKPGRPRNRS
jgi:hypothetical protein